jgi:hypothetical protein
MARHHAVMRWNEEEVRGIPRASEEAFEPSEIAGKFSERPPVVARDFGSAVPADGGLRHGGGDVGQAIVMAVETGELIDQIRGIVRSVAGDEVLERDSRSKDSGEILLAKGAIDGEVFDPARALEIGTGVSMEFTEVTLAAAEEKSKTVMGAGDGQGTVSGTQADDAAVAQAVSQGDRLAMRSAVHSMLQCGMKFFRRTGMEAHFQVVQRHIRAGGAERFEFALKDAAGNDMKTRGTHEQSFYRGLRLRALRIDSQKHLAPAIEFSSCFHIDASQ